MPKYRVKQQQTREMYIDVVADSLDEALSNAEGILQEENQTFHDLILDGEFNGYEFDCDGAEISFPEPTAIPWVQAVLEEDQLYYKEGNAFLQINVRSVDETARRAIVSAILASCAYDLYDAEDPEIFVKEAQENLSRFGVSQSLFQNEQLVLDEKRDKDDEVGWSSYAADALLWALGLHDEMPSADNPFDPEEDIHQTAELVKSYDDLDALLSECDLKTTDELYDMYELFWWYNWNINDSRINHYFLPTPLSHDVVMEVRRALQWLIFSDEDENGTWFNISMDT